MGKRVELKDITNSMWFEILAENALFDEKHEFLAKVRADEKYKDNYDYALMNYRKLKLQPEYEGVKRTTKELRMFDQAKTMQFELSAFALRDNKDYYAKALGEFLEYGKVVSEESLSSMKTVFEDLLFRAAREGLNDLEFASMVAALANSDVDTTVEDIKSAPLFDKKNETKYIGIREERPRTELPDLKKLTQQIPDKVIDSITTAFKQKSKISLKKQKTNDFTLTFNNQEVIKMADEYSTKILKSYKKLPARYEHCHTAMDVVNTYFDPNGRSKNKFNALAKDLDRFANIEEQGAGIEA